jgi:hypothetical protein
MQMLARLRYLITEGFDVSALSCYGDECLAGNAKIVYISRCPGHTPVLVTEIFTVLADEMEMCSALFIAHFSRSKES